MGIYDAGCGKLASFDVAFVDAGSRVVRDECGGVSLDERGLASVERAGPVFYV